MTLLEPTPDMSRRYELDDVFVHHPAELDPAVRTLPAGAPTVTVVIPVKNEAANLPWVIARLPHGVTEVVIVDGHSTDDTVDVARALCPEARIVEQSRRGKGNAMACGFSVATGEILVMLDADGSAHPAEIVDFVEVLMAGADFAKGSRFAAGGGSSDISRVRRSGNAVLSWLVNRLYRTQYTDLCYGYNAFWRHCLPFLELPSTVGNEAQAGDGFEIETLINIRMAQSPLAVKEVASYESARLHGTSNLNALRDGLRVLGVILREWRAARGNDKPQTSSLPALAQLIPAPAYPDLDVAPSLVTRELADSEDVA